MCQSGPHGRFGCHRPVRLDRVVHGALDQTYLDAKSEHQVANIESEHFVGENVR